MFFSFLCCPQINILIVIKADCDVSSLIWLSSPFIIHSGCSSWIWERLKSCMNWTRTPGNTGSVWGRKTCGVSTDYIKGRSFKPSLGWQRTSSCISGCFQPVWTEMADMVFSPSWMKNRNSTPCQFRQLSKNHAAYSVALWWQYIKAVITLIIGYVKKG